MKELKELHWKDTKSKINHLVNSWRRETPYGISTENFFYLRNLLINEIQKEINVSLKDKKIFSTGHQPDVHHPGILTKDIVLSYLLDENSIGIHFVVDTDHFEFEYFYPTCRGRDAEVHQFSAHSHSTFESEKVEDSKREELISILNKQKEELKFFVNPNALPFSMECLDIYIEKIKSNFLLHKINDQIHSKFLQSQGIQILKFPVSKLVKTKTFLTFVDLIRKRQKEFQKIHNQALETYRKEHKIKNHAQPLPNLQENEMPFWAYKNHERVSFGVNENPNCILPRAITLTLFLRIFFCDFFIHGTGGARYEKICDTISKEFFQIESCPYEVATATMHFSPNANFDLPKYEQKELEKKLREIEYSPEHFLNSEHPQVIQKRKLLEEFKNPNSNKKELHQKIKELNQIMKQELINLEQELQSELNLLDKKNKTKQVFETRNFPFFYYNLEELIQEIKRRIE